MKLPTLLTADQVNRIHDHVLNPGEITGMAGGKSLDSALARVETRILYEGISAPAEIAAAYALAVSRGHCFNDGNKRTAYRVMTVVMQLNGGVSPHLGTTAETGDLIIAMARGDLKETDLVRMLTRSDPSPSPS